MHRFIQQIEASELAYQQLIQAIFQYYLQKNFQETRKEKLFGLKRKEDQNQQQLVDMHEFSFEREKEQEHRGKEELGLQEQIIEGIKAKIEECKESLDNELQIFLDRVYRELMDSIEHFMKLQLL